MNLHNIAARLIPTVFIFRSIVLWSLLFSVPATLADDADVLLELASATQLNLPGWNINNKANLCSNWHNVTCDGYNRVVGLIITNVRTGFTLPRPLMRGTIPASFTQLTSLQNLDLHYNNLYGDLPPAIFTMPNLERLWIETNALFIKSPPVITSPLKFLSLEDNWLNDTLPELNWGAFDYAGFGNIAAKCPLPQSFVDAFKRGLRPRGCNIRGNNFWIDSNNFLCGQLDVRNVSCEVFPMPYKPRYFATDDRPSVQFRAEILNHTIEFDGRDASIFAAYRTKNGVRKEYRKEYMSFRAEPSTEYEQNFGRIQYGYALPLGNWESFLVEGGTRVRANTTKQNDMITEFIFDWIIQPDQPPNIKFSTVVYNLGHVWVQGNNTYERLTTSLSFTFSYRVVHSPTSSTGSYRPLSCFYVNQLTTLCDSSVLRFSADANSMSLCSFSWQHAHHRYSMSTQHQSLRRHIPYWQSPQQPG
eukprot:TRINITY_DN1029_c0_g1_i2.p1 TRINITY_DN1029_c0_g1~~TRINITY_DN1029_c0_g1_i2.p1  ORF type:complete len:474 (+),score=24.91 TRINITY_DN1029_c0_g1_i2:692-2113(+)